ncbi:MAG TPA: DUF362 domain-containing protein [Gemmatimonadales bacterium]|nr:DUF362 domain-containing protein [Gemmatimonadales bacterium]
MSVLPEAAYPVAHARVGDYDPELIGRALAQLSSALGWSGTAGVPFAGLLPAGANVVVKPNWVMHANKGPWGEACLVTQGTLIRAIVQQLLAAGAGWVTIGDAPIQACDFAALLRLEGMDVWAGELSVREPRFGGVRDFRRTRSRLEDGILVQDEEQVPLSEFVRFDLGKESLLEPVTWGANPFRVTQYDPSKMAETHHVGRHQYLVARAVMEADVIVNVPKLKTHRKAGVTNALKNLVGINGNKEYLPHHRVGGAGAGGDCYPGLSRIKRLHEAVLDLQNGVRSHLGRRMLNVPQRALSLMGRLLVDPLGVEGAWSGNDTVWRMCLDLNRVLLYGRPDGTLAEVPQRRVISIVDAVIAGQGDGPLAPEPFPLGLLLAGENPAAIDWLGSRLLGYVPERIPLVREAFSAFRWPIAPLGSRAVRPVAADGLPLQEGPGPASYPIGWLDAVDRGQRRTPPIGRSFSRARPGAALAPEA